MSTEFYQDWKELLALFNEHEVNYMMVGGLAVSQHGFPRYTKDLDLLVERTPRNAARILAALEAFGFGGIGLKEEDFIKVGNFIQLGYEPVRVDLITSIDGVEWDEADAGKIVGDFDGVPVPVIGREELVKSKRAAGRPEDLLDIRKLGEDV